MFVCNPSNDPDFIVNNYIGVGMELGTTKLSPGNWGFIGNSPNNNERADVLGWNAAPTGCVAVDDQELPVNTGNNTNGKVVDAFNTRFDMGSCPGNGSCSASTNATKDLVNSSSGCSTTWGEAVKPYAPAAGTLNPLLSNGSQDPTAMGYPRDICQASGGNCRVRGPAGVPATVGDGVWDIDAYFRVNYGGIDHAGWMAATGLPAKALRYDVYRWESAHPTASLNGHSPMSTRSFA